MFRWLLHLTADDDSLAFSTARKESLSRKLRHWVVGRPTNRSRLTLTWSQLQADCEELANGVSLGGGNSVPLALRGDPADLIASVTLSVFVVEQQGDRFRAQGRVLIFHLHARRRRDGSCVTTVVVANTTFAPVWMGSHWDALGFSPQSQPRQIIVKLYAALARLEKPPVDQLVVDDDTVAGLSLVFRCFIFFLMVGFG